MTAPEWIRCGFAVFGECFAWCSSARIHMGQQAQGAGGLLGFRHMKAPLMDDYGHYTTEWTPKSIGFFKKSLYFPFVDKAPVQVYTDNISETDRS